MYYYAKTMVLVRFNIKAINIVYYKLYNVIFGTPILEVGLCKCRYLSNFVNCFPAHFSLHRKYNMRHICHSVFRSNIK